MDEKDTQSVHVKPQLETQEVFSSDIRFEIILFMLKETVISVVNVSKSQSLDDNNNSYSL